MPKRKSGDTLMSIYRALFGAFGPQFWWPGDTPFEVMVGAVLTQNTAWANVEKAIANLKAAGLLSPRRLAAVPAERLAEHIRPSGYYNIKTKRLRSLLEFLETRYQGSTARMAREEPAVLRRGLLTVNGIGQETADSILLYAAARPYFVVDAYTLRVFSRHGLVREGADYAEVQRLFMENLPHDAALFNEYHALIVRLGKEYCKKTRPRCDQCPLKNFLKKPRTKSKSKKLQSISGFFSSGNTRCCRVKA